MKSIKLWILIFIPFVLSCSEEELHPNDEINNIKSRALRTVCDINGNSCGSPNGTLTLTYSSDFNPNDVNWSIQSGNISIISGQGTSTVTLRFGSSFNGGSVLAIGSGNGGIICSDSYSLTKCIIDPPQCTPPTFIRITQSPTIGACPGEIFTFTADPNGSTDNGSYQWSSFQGSTIVSGQGTSTVRIQSPSSGGFSVSVNHVNACQNTSLSGFTIAQFDDGCDGGGFGF